MHICALLTPSHCRCIFLELFTRRPIFQGNDEIHQVQVLFDVLGAVTTEDWPALDALPWYELVKPTQSTDETGAQVPLQYCNEERFRKVFAK